MKKSHIYKTNIRWTGNKGLGTKDYTAYERSYTISVDHKMDIPASADPSFRGDAGKHNPEELLVASLSSCHMLWYLHLCAVNNICVLDYHDNAVGIMEETAAGGGHFREVTLQPVIRISEGKLEEKARQLHQEANKLCFIANSCNFPVYHKPTILVGNDQGNDLEDDLEKQGLRNA